MAKSLKRNKLAGFSLLEVIITLGVCCGILLIGSLQLKRYQEKLIFDNTVKRVMTALDQTSRYSTIKEVTIGVSYLARSNQILFSGGKYHKSIPVDQNIKITGLDHFKFNLTGYSKPGTVTFSGYGMEKSLKYQMLWGRVAE